MISFRSHVVSLLAVFLALAIGVVLGSGPLQRESDTGKGQSDAEALAEADATIEELRAGATFDDAYARATSSRLLDDKLSRRAVTVVALPGADPDAIARVSALITKAGGSVTGQVGVAEKLVDVGNRQLVAELASQMEESAGKQVSIPADASGYERIGRLLGYAISTPKRGGGDTPDDTAEAIMAGLDTAEMVTGGDELQRRGSLVLVVAGSPSGSADEREGAGSIVASLAAALDGQCDGTVMLGPIGSGAADGVVGALRADSAASRVVSTVDVGDRGAGAVLGVLALASEAGGESVHLGTTAAEDGAFPK